MCMLYMCTHGEYMHAMRHFNGLAIGYLPRDLQNRVTGTLKPGILPGLTGTGGGAAGPTTASVTVTKPGLLGASITAALGLNWQALQSRVQETAVSASTPVHPRAPDEVGNVGWVWIHLYTLLTKHSPDNM